MWPLDPAAFGHPGYFVIMSRLNEPIPTGPEAGGVRFTRSADLGDLGVLSPRELEIYYYLAAGMTAGDIAQALHRSEKTIGRHVENIHRKMLYSSRAELVRDAVQRGLIAFTGKEWLDSGTLVERINFTADYVGNEVRTIQIRGMAPEMGSVTMDGTRMASSQSANLGRQFEYETASLGNIDTVELNKALLPDMEADAVSARVVPLRIRRP